MIAKVVFNNREHNIDKFFDYEIPYELENDIKPGVRVNVPLGKGNITARGIVVEIKEQSEYNNLKAIKSCIDTVPVCSEKMIKLCMWIKEKCFCSFYQALKLVVPPGMDSGIKSKTQRYISLHISQDDAYKLILKYEKKGAKNLASVLKCLDEFGELSVSEIYEKSSGNSATIADLIKKGYVVAEEKIVERRVFDKNRIKSSAPYIPTDEQREVIDYLNEKITSNQHDKVLLRGVTGSGKTEVFLQAIETALSQGKKAIMLVPEISLTPQTVNRFVSRFGDYVAVIHSRLSQGERYDEWKKIRDGRVGVVVGARSAVFAPFDNVGIIILDEEHENSYKSDSSPRYHAVDVAAKRAEEDNAVLLLASATPSVSHYYKAKIGEFKLFEMHKRYNDMSLPDVDVVDMRGELFNNKNRSPLSFKLQREIRKNLENKCKTILFLNRRGYSTFVSCRECGYVVSCPDCDIALTYHKKNDNLVCHYCGYTTENINICPECGSKYVRYFGTGTQKIEEELKKIFPDAVTMRMDFDTTSQKGGHEKILEEFLNKGDILLGTQMVTKGLDFHDVTLVGILAADTTLCMDDYRAAERSFSLFTQVCGRAGRGEVPGRAIIQTYQPFNAIIDYAAKQNYELFYKEEIKSRRRLFYPPFCDIVCIVATGDSEELAWSRINEAGKIIKEFSDNYSGRVDVIEPQAAPISKIKNQFRFRIVLKIDNADSIIDTLNILKENYSFDKNGVYLSIDINPVNMY